MEGGYQRKGYTEKNFYKYLGEVNINKTKYIYIFLIFSVLMTFFQRSTERLFNDRWRSRLLFVKFTQTQKTLNKSLSSGYTISGS